MPTEPDFSAPDVALVEGTKEDEGALVELPEGAGDCVEGAELEDGDEGSDVDLEEADLVLQYAMPSILVMSPMKRSGKVRSSPSIKICSLGSTLASIITESAVAPLNGSYIELIAASKSS